MQPLQPKQLQVISNECVSIMHNAIILDLLYNLSVEERRERIGTFKSYAKSFIKRCKKMTIATFCMIMERTSVLQIESYAAFVVYETMSFLKYIPNRVTLFENVLKNT